MESRINISLPSPLKKWVERQAAENGYSTTDEYFREMIRREQALAEREKIDDLLTEAINGGEMTPMTGKDWERIGSAGRKLARVRRKK